MKCANMDLAFCEDLALRGARGDKEACRRLVEHLWPVWLVMVGSSRRMGSLAKSEDHVRNVAARLVSKIHEHGLGLYLSWREQHNEATFADWMRIVAANVERAYVAACLGPRPAPGQQLSQKRLLNEAALSPLMDQLGMRPPFTAEATARRLLEFARSRLPADQQRALELWLEDRAFDEIGGELGLPTAQARKLVRAAVAVLRRQFGTDREGPPT